MNNTFAQIVWEESRCEVSIASDVKDALQGMTSKSDLRPINDKSG